MQAVRIIPCLDIDNGRVVKGVNYLDLRDAGDPVELAGCTATSGADELVILDITASSDGRATTVDVVSRAAEEVFIPLTVGGGIRSVDDARRLLRAGADKVCGQHGRRRAARARRGDRGRVRCPVRRASPSTCEAVRPGFEVFTHGGRSPTGIDAIEWVARGAALGAGEMLVTSMDRDGTELGYDLELLAADRGSGGRIP